MSFNSKIIRVGTITVSFAIFANFLPGIYLWLAYDTIPSLNDLIVIWTTMAAAFGVSWFIQPLSYFGSLGTAGSYIAWIAGSAADIRIPAVTMAQKVANVEPNTPKGDIIATLALATSVFVSISLVTIFALAGTSLFRYCLNMFKLLFYILPSLFAAVYTSMTLKDISHGSVILKIGLILLKVFLCLVFRLHLTCFTCIDGFVSKFIHSNRQNKKRCFKC